MLTRLEVMQNYVGGRYSLSDGIISRKKLSGMEGIIVEYFIEKVDWNYSPRGIIDNDSNMVIDKCLEFDRKTNVFNELSFSYVVKPITDEEKESNRNLREKDIHVIVTESRRLLSLHEVEKLVDKYVDEKNAAEEKSRQNIRSLQDYFDDLTRSMIRAERSSKPARKTILAKKRT